MSNKIGFVAIGQAAGNIGQLFEKKGYTVLYLNTSVEDLSTLENGTHKYHITGGEGCNKDRNKAKQLIIDDFDNIAAKIDDTVDAKIIFVIFAAGGGTGSGAGPMLVDLLLDEGSRKIGIVTILPAISESIKSQYNAYECFSELTAISNSAACFILDNNNGEKLEINKCFADSFHSFVNIPESYISAKGNIDTAEVQETLSTHGAALIIASGDSNVSNMMALLKKSIYAPLENDKRLKYVALAADDTFEHTTEICKEVGTPLDIYRAYTSKESVVCIAGCSYPYERLFAIKQIINDNKNVITASENEQRLNMDFDFVKSTVQASDVNNKPNKPKTRKDIMSKYLSAN